MAHGQGGRTIFATVSVFAIERLVMRAPG
jgi:hypothetical protein